MVVGYRERIDIYYPLLLCIRYAISCRSTRRDTHTNVSTSRRLPKQHSMWAPIGPQLGPGWARLGPIWECCLGGAISNRGLLFDVTAMYLSYPCAPSQLGIIMVGCRYDIKVMLCVFSDLATYIAWLIRMLL